MEMLFYVDFEKLYGKPWIKIVIQRNNAHEGLPVT